jgi:predicted phage terminase large subunit-like protein
MLGPHGTAAQLQQLPSARGGVIFPTSWWRYYPPEERPRDFDEVAMSWDTALSGDSSADYSVGQAWGLRGEDRYLLKEVREQLTFPELLDQCKVLYEWVTCQFPRHPYPAVYIEAAATGPALVETLRNEVPTLIPVPVSDSKFQRAQAVVPMIHAGHVHLPGAANQTGDGFDPSRTPIWVQNFIHEHTLFRSGCRNDDRIDAMTLALLKIGRGPRIFVLEG